MDKKLKFPFNSESSVQSFTDFRQNEIWQKKANPTFRGFITKLNNMQVFISKVWSMADLFLNTWPPFSHSLLILFEKVT